MSPGARRGADLLLLAEVAAAAIVGGLLAMAVLKWDEGGDLPIRLLLFIVAVVTLVAVLTVASLRSGRSGRGEDSWDRLPRPAPPPVSVRRPGEERGDAPQVAPDWWDAVHPPVGEGPVPAERPDGDGVPPSLPTFPAPLRPPEPPTDTRQPDYQTCPVPGAPGAGRTRVRRIVQCPGCGDFDVHLRQQGKAFAFTCRRCGHGWTWARNEPWPATVVRPTAAPQRPVRDTGPV